VRLFGSEFKPSHELEPAKMLMKSKSSSNAVRRLGESLDAAAGRLRSNTRQLYRALKHRRQIAALANQSDYLLTDIGMTRDDLRHAAAEPLWRDPSDTLRQRAGATWRAALLKDSASADHLDRRAFADTDLGHLSDLGCRIRPDPRRQFVRACLAGLAAGLMVFLAGTEAMAQSFCRPRLAISDVQFSPMQPPTLQRKWTAIVSVDASRCAENAHGTFEIGFSRLKENAPEIDFHESFGWQSPSVKVDVDFWADEAVEAYWLRNIAACPCRG
jgi:uncharacterized protein YjiS (DUF1127 family)